MVTNLAVRLSHENSILSSLQQDCYMFIFVFSTCHSGTSGLCDNVEIKKPKKIVFGSDDAVSPPPVLILGADVVDWLYTHVEGFKDRREARKYASSMLKHGYLRHTVNKITFSEQCYYVFGDLCGSKFPTCEGQSCVCVVSSVLAGESCGISQVAVSEQAVIRKLHEKCLMLLLDQAVRQLGREGWTYQTGHCTEAQESSISFWWCHSPPACQPHSASDL